MTGKIRGMYIVLINRNRHVRDKHSNIMPRIFYLLCIILSTTSLPAEDTLLFSSRKVPVTLSSKDGQQITAVIQDVWLEQEQARIFVKEQKSTFTVSFALFDENSVAVLQDWFYKRLVNERFSIKNENAGAEDNNTQQSMNFTDRRSYSVPSSNQQSTSISTRKRQIVANIHNPTNHTVRNLHVLHGVKIGTSYSDSGRKINLDPKEATFNSQQDFASIASRSELTSISSPIDLTTVTINYTITVTVNRPPMPPYEETRRHSRRETDRIHGYYTLVYYKDELVAAGTNRHSLIDPSLMKRPVAQQNPRTLMQMSEFMHRGAMPYIPESLTPNLPQMRPSNQ